MRKTKRTKMIPVNEVLKAMVTLTIFERLTALGWFEAVKGGYIPTNKGHDKLLNIVCNKRNSKAIDNSGIDMFSGERHSYEELATAVVFAKLTSLGWLDEKHSWTIKGLNYSLRLFQRLPLQSHQRIANYLGDLEGKQ